MKLIADGGSTKTEWCLCDEGVLLKRIFTGGMNPYILNDAEITRLLRNDLLPMVNSCSVTEIHYYGAGCRDAVIPRVKTLLGNVFPSASSGINVYSDVVAAARALFGNESGIACILGTGSNSCYYDGRNITDGIPPMGYILGDEGSGAHIGKTLVNAIFKRRMPQEIIERFKEQTGLTADDVIRRTYRESEPGKFLASLTHFVGDNISHPEMDRMVTECFRCFFRNNIASYNHGTCKIGAIGSVAFYFNQQLQKAGLQEGYEVSRILKSPMSGLLQYHNVIENN